MVIFEPLLAILITMSLFSERDLRALLSLGVMLLVVGFGLSASLFRVCLVVVKYVSRSRFPVLGGTPSNFCLTGWIKGVSLFLKSLRDLAKSSVAG